MKKILVIGVLCMAVLATVIYNKLTAPKIKTIAIVTTLSHPALASARAGFVKRLREAYNESQFAIVDYNAESNPQQANLIAQKIASDDNVVGIFAIGTLAAQSVAKAERTRPIVIAAVSDPNSIIAETATNVCGLTDSISPDYQIDSILKLLPDVKTISLLYSPSEANSVSMVKDLTHALAKRNLKANLVGVHDVQQIMAASHQACIKGDAVLIPLDNQLVASMPAVIKATRALACPVIASNESPIHQGATIAFAVDYEKSGEHAGTIIRHILEQVATPNTIRFIDPTSVGIYLNDRIVAEKNITIAPNAVENLIRIESAS